MDTSSKEEPAGQAERKVMMSQADSLCPIRLRRVRFSLSPIALLQLQLLLLLLQHQLSIE